MKAAGRSTLDRCPACEMTSSRLPGIRSCMARASFTGVIASSSPTTISVGTSIVARIDVESGRTIIASSAPTMPSTGAWAIMRCIASYVSGCFSRDVFPIMLGIWALATAVAPSTCAS